MCEASANNRLERIRGLVHETFEAMASERKRKYAYIQLNGVSSFASMMALKRGQSEELAAIIGLLHNYYEYKTGVPQFPGPNSADTVRPLLKEMNIFTDEELTTILRAIFYQKDRTTVHGTYEEIIKDAYVLHLYFQDSNRTLDQLEDVTRLRNVLREMTIPEHTLINPSPTDRYVLPQHIDKRSKLADIAESLAKENIIGLPSDQRYREICKYWPDHGIYEVLHSNWCAAFVYHCCMQAGFYLPIRYPNAKYRLAGVGAWLEWSILPENDFFNKKGQHGFTPERGDIIVYDQLLSDKAHDHIGIVLACDANEILVAEGNRDNENYSSVFYRDQWQCILGYIRIPNHYSFHYHGDYNPIPTI